MCGGEAMATSAFTIKCLIGFSDRCKLICTTLTFMKLAPEVIEKLIGKGKT